MSVFANKTAVLLPTICLGAWLDAGAQLASTQLDGLRVSIASIYRSGDSRDLDCSIGLKFTGEKADRAVSMSPVKIIQAVDDTGMDLVRTNIHAFPGNGWPPGKTALWFWQMVGGLKAPAPNAKTIRHLEAEVELFAPNAGTPILTNFMSRPGAILHQPMLDQYQVKISYDRKTNNLPPGSLIIDDSPAGKTKGKTIWLKVDDPQQKLVSLAFQKADGGILPAISESRGIFGSHTEFTYGFSEKPPPDLNLVVYVASPEASDKVRFSFENIRLPWVDLPDFQVRVEPMMAFPEPGTNPYVCNLRLNFTGGPLTNVLGIRQLWINKAEDEAGRAVNAIVQKGDWQWRSPFVGLTENGEGRNVKKHMLLTFQSGNPRVLRVLEGEAELVSVNATNIGKVEIKDFMNHAGQSYDLPVLKTNNVKLTYFGSVNFAAKDLEFKKTNGVVENGRLISEEYPSDKKNSLEFSLDDPDNVVIAPWGHNEITFLDNNGLSLPVESVMTVIENHHRVYRFSTFPPPAAQLIVYLAVPESLQRIPFKIENIPLR